MADQGSEFSFYQSILKGIHIRIDASISMRPMATKFSKQVHLEELIQMGLIKQVLVMPSPEDHMASHKDHVTNKYLHYQSAYGHQYSRMVTYLDGLQLIKSHEPYITWSCKIM